MLDDVPAAQKRSAVLPPLDLTTAVVDAWKTSNRVNVLLVEGVPAAAWAAPAPGLPQRSIRWIAAHLHNSRRGWIRTLGAPHGIAVPERVDPRKVTRRELVAALRRSSRGMVELLELGGRHGGRIPPTPKYVWRNLPLDVGHVLAYFVAHEGHHRGQIVMLARQMGHRLPREVTDGIWQFTRLSKEERGR